MNSQTAPYATLTMRITRADGTVEEITVPASVTPVTPEKPHG